MPTLLVGNGFETALPGLGRNTEFSSLREDGDEGSPSCASPAVWSRSRRGGERRRLFHERRMGWRMPG